MYPRSTTRKEILKKLVISTLIFSLLIINFKAATNYQYVTNKGDLGLAYEIVNIEFTQNTLKLDGWAFSPTTSHYQKNTAATKIKVSGSDGNAFYETARITNKYNMTDIMRYAGVNKCASNATNIDEASCYLDYKYVGFELEIPLSKFKVGNKYSFQIYHENTVTGRKVYSQLYTPGTNLMTLKGDLEYKFESNIDEVDLKVNDDLLLVRSGPGKNYSVKQYNKKDMYYQLNGRFKGSQKQKNGYINWYKVKFKPTNTIYQNHYVAKPGSVDDGWLPSQFVDYLGDGYSELIVRKQADVGIKNIYYPVVENNKPVVIYGEIESKNVDPNQSIDIMFMYKQYSQKQQIKIKDNKFKFELPNVNFDGTKTFQIAILKNQSAIYDTNFSNDIMFANFELIKNENVNKQLNKTSTSIGYDQPSGFKKENNKVTTYYEKITFTLTPPITKINDKLTNYNTQISNFYAGGVFDYPLAITQVNNYPYAPNLVQPQVQFKINCNYIQISDSCSSYLLKKMDYNASTKNYQLPKIFRTKSNKITYSPGNEQVEYTNNVVYTKYRLNQQKYNFELLTSEIGVNKTKFSITSYFEVKGNLFEKNKNSLLYARLLNRDNLFPNKSSKLWSDKLTNAINNQSIKSIKYKITPEATSEIKKYIAKNYEQNLNGNNQEFNALITKLIAENKIQEVK